MWLYSDYCFTQRKAYGYVNNVSGGACPKQQNVELLKFLVISKMRLRSNMPASLVQKLIFLFDDAHMGKEGNMTCTRRSKLPLLGLSSQLRYQPAASLWLASQVVCFQYGADCLRSQLIRTTYRRTVPSFGILHSVLAFSLCIRYTRRDDSLRSGATEQ